MSNRLVKRSSVLFIALCLATPAFAGTYTDAVSRCFANSTTGKDRIDLARWVFANMALHPDVVNISAITLDKREEINKAAGTLFNRLLANDCNKEIKESIKFEDQAALKVAFESLGRLAMQELTSNPSVGSGFSGLEKFVDLKKLKDALQ